MRDSFIKTLIKGRVFIPLTRQPENLRPIGYRMLILNRVTHQIHYMAIIAPD